LQALIRHPGQGHQLQQLKVSLPLKDKINRFKIKIEHNDKQVAKKTVKEIVPSIVSVRSSTDIKPGFV
jgi:hypothetical protein